MVWEEWYGKSIESFVSFPYHISLLHMQLLRKRHIGNDIVTLVFQEPGCEQFSAKCIRSHFQHIFIVVRVVDPNTEHTKYRWGLNINTIVSDLKTFWEQPLRYSVIWWKFRSAVISEVGSSTVRGDLIFFV